MTDREPARGLDLEGGGRALLDAVLAISSDLDLHSVLNRIVASACAITGASYGALGVLDHQGGLGDFITVGLTEQEHRAIGELPRGHGILGLLIDHPQPLRLEHLQAHPRSFGFPPNHPPMERFLGVPVRIRGTVFGNLYLTDRVDGEDFTEQDEHLVSALATAAGFVVGNANAYAQSERRRQWLEASAQVSEALQPPVRVDDALRQILLGARRVSGASEAAVVQSDQSGHRGLAAADGANPDRVAELVSGLDRDIARAETAGEVVIVPGRAGGTVVLVPLRTHLSTSGGVLLVSLDGDRGSLDTEVPELLSSFADQAALALDRAQAIADRQDLMLVADRDRIARDLHDLVIQRLFATGLQLQGALRNADGEGVRERIEAAVSDLDVTIRDIRSTIFELQGPEATSLRGELRAIAKEYVPVLGFTPLVRTVGPVDTAVSRPIGEQLLAVLREGLSNVARHSEADAAMVEIEVAQDRVVLRVTDNGQGVPAARHESGLRNVRLRAAEHGGALRIIPEEPHGTILEWMVPLDATPVSQ